MNKYMRYFLKSKKIKLTHWNQRNKLKYFLSKSCFWFFEINGKMSVVKNELKRAGKIVTTQATEDGKL